MGSMSASDAAPLPRLGEVFFDVRGESRTMRLSWYADTGVAVFSIWQGGTCTGTFRLPIADLPRMVEALRRGPHGHDDQVTGEQPGSREPRLPAAPGPPPPRPELDRDIGTGQTTAVHAPPAGPDLTGYQAPPDPAGYRAGPEVTGYQAGPELTGYQAPPERTGYQAGPEVTGYQAGPELTGYQAPPERTGYQAGPEPTGYQAGPDPAGYQAGPEPAGYQAEPPQPGYPPEPPARYRDQPLAGDPGYQTAPRPQPGHRAKAPRRRRGSPPAPAVTAKAGPGHRDVAPAGDPGEYPAGLAPGFPDEYPAEPPAADFSAARGSRHRGREQDEDPAGYFDEPPAPDLPHEYPSGYQAEPEPGYPGEALEGYLTERGYLAEDLEPDYPREYRDYPEYPDDLAATEYGPPARPYLEDAPGTDEPFADAPPEPAKRRGRRRAGPSPDSFPYGPPPDSGASGQQERYPRQH